MREKSHAGGVTFSGASFLPAVCVLFCCVLDGERCVGGWVGRCPGKKVTLGDRIVCGWVGGHFSLRVAWVSSPPTYLQKTNIFDSSEFNVKFSAFCCEEPSMLIVCGWVGGALFMLPAVVFGPPTHLHTFSSFGFSKTCLF